MLDESKSARRYQTRREQEYSEDPRDDRSTDHYQAEYVQSLVEKWDALIDWNRRAQSEGTFFIDLLRRLGKHRVLDVATGTGFHSVQLLKAGFDVTSADGNGTMLAKAFENAKQRGFVLHTVHADWRWLNRSIAGKYDAIICLGNSFTHLFKERDRRRALAEFYAALKHDGVLILDQRNYDTILDHGFSSKHEYYYCGEEVKAAPEYVDEGLARFRYEFPDGTHFHLNMFPLRKRYMHDLMKQVGFQDVITYGDFQETYAETEPDFFVHVATKHFDPDPDEDPPMSEASAPTIVAEQYYDSADADAFYFEIWGGEDIHIGLYQSDDDAIAEASQRTVKTLADRIAPLPHTSRILDLGAGYGGAARYLARRFECEVTCLNLSETQNERNRTINAQQGLDRIDVVHGNFEHLPFEDASFDVAWSQDSLLHSGARARVIHEAARVLVPGGQFVFTDPMQAPDAPAEVLGPILERIHLDDLASFDFYREAAREAGLEVVEFRDMTEHLARHYARVRRELEARREQLRGRVDDGYITRMLEGLGRWAEAGAAGHLAWGIMHLRKPG